MLTFNGHTRLRSYQVGALPLLNHFFERLELGEVLRSHLPADDVRRCIASEGVILLMVQEHVSSEGYRLLGFRSRRKAVLDEAARGQRCRRAIQELDELQRRLLRPRTRFRQRAQVEQAVNQILSDRKMESLLKKLFRRRLAESA